jgi:hypothetical protein
MSGVRPVVRYLILCQEVVVDPTNPLQVTLVNLVSTIRSLSIPAFPVIRPQICAFIQMTECRGAGDLWVEIVHADSGSTVFRTQTRNVAFGNDPLEVLGLTFRIRNCPFPSAGLYWVQLWYDNGVLAQQALVVR